MTVRARTSFFLFVVLVLLGGCREPTGPEVPVDDRIAALHLSADRWNEPGDDVGLKLFALDVNRQLLDDVVVAWTSSDSKVVAVDASGVATALKPGSAEITARNGGHTASVTVIVAQPVVSANGAVHFVPDPDSRFDGTTIVPTSLSTPDDSRLIGASAFVFDAGTRTKLGQIDNVGELVVSYASHAIPPAEAANLKLAQLMDGRWYVMSSAADTVKKRVWGSLFQLFSGPVTYALFSPAGVRITSYSGYDQISLQGGTYSVSATVESEPAITEVYMMIAGQRFALTGSGAAYNASVALSGLAAGMYAVEITAVNAMGRRATTTRQLRVRDAPPTIEISEPDNYAATLTGRVRLRVTCRDDLPAGCASITASTNWGETILATGTQSIDQDVVLPATGSLSVVARDTAGNVAQAFRYVTVLRHGGVVEVARARGRVYDYDGHGGMLYVDSAATTLRWKRVGGTDIAVAADAFVGAARFVTPDHFWFTTRVPKLTPGPDRWNFLEWRDGAVRLIAADIDQQTPLVEESFGVWTTAASGTRDLHRRNMNDGSTILVRDMVGDANGPAPHFVAPNGDVVYVRRTAPAGVYRFRDGNHELLSPESFDYVRTDGVTTVAVAHGRVGLVFTGTVVDTLPPIPSSSSRPVPVNVAGWLVYPRKREGAGFEFLMRSRDGSVSVLHPGPAEGIVYLTPDPQAVLSAIGGKQLARPGQNARLIDDGIWAHRGTALFLIVGTTVFRVE